MGFRDKVPRKFEVLVDVYAFQWEGDGSVQRKVWLIMVLYILYLNIEMEQFTPFLPYQCLYTSIPTQFCHSGQLIVQGSLFPQNILAQELLKLETSYAQLSFKYHQLLQQNESLKERLENALSEPPHSQAARRLKRKIRRRKQTELDKKYHCCYDHCKKQYASMLALNLHIKTRHGGGTKKQRDSLAKQIILAELKGETVPKAKISLPSDYVEKYRQEHFQSVGGHHDATAQ